MRSAREVFTESAATPDDGPTEEDVMTAAAKTQEADVATKKSAKELIESPDFKALVKKRWAVSFSLLAVLFVGYYGYILLVATNKAWVSQPIAEGSVVTRAIPLGIGAIVLAWVLVAIYVYWANASYDPEVERLKDQLKH
jgi:uncharacterized membrane protein (DUF485 family)